MTPQPSSPTAAARASGSTFVHWPAATSVFSAKAPMPSAGESSVPSSQGHLLGGVVGGEAVPGLAARAGPTAAADGAPVEDHEVARRDVGDALAHRLHDPRRLVPEQEREVVVDPALPVVQVGVADAARLHPHHGLARAGVGHVDRHLLHRLALGHGDDSLHLLHVCTPWLPTCEPAGYGWRLQRQRGVGSGRVRRRGLEGLVCPALTGRYRQSLGDAVSAAAAAVVGHCGAATPPFTLPAGSAPPAPARATPTLVARWLGGEVVPGGSPDLEHAGGPAPGVLARGVGRGRYSSGGCDARSRVTSVVPRWSRRNW